VLRNFVQDSPAGLVQFCAVGSTWETAAVAEIRRCRPDEHPTILEIVNAAAAAYRGVIPDDCWHEPYMPRRELEAEMAAGVMFWGYEIDDVLVGVMGIQRVLDVDLIRHAYVRPASQRRGVGIGLLEHLRSTSRRRMLVGTWAAATWAIRFYRRHGFELIPDEHKTPLLERYWTVPKRQIEASVVLANPPLEGADRP
jgi:GNAT superfamily N-acetyltransferase